MAPDDESTEPTDDSRKHGIEFGALDDALDDHEFPATREELTAAFGDYELEMGGGTETFGTVLARHGDEAGPDDRQEFESAAAVRQAVFTLVGTDAIGREEYTDRGGSLEESGDEQSADDRTL